jgi:hypothetical protein
MRMQITQIRLKPAAIAMAATEMSRLTIIPAFTAKSLATRSILRSE